MNREYRKLYIKFIDLEIPNFLQILGVLSLISFLLKNIYLSIFAISIASLLFDRYMSAKFFEFVKTQICDPHSELNRWNIDDEKFQNHYGKFIFLSSLLFFSAASLVAWGISFRSL